MPQLNDVAACSGNKAIVELPVGEILRGTCLNRHGNYAVTRKGAMQKSQPPVVENANAGRRAAIPKRRTDITGWIQKQKRPKL